MQMKTEQCSQMQQRGARQAAQAGAAATVLLLMAVWIRQIVLVDTARIRALLDHVS